MTRKKRVSLKDKGPEALGLTPKKGKGIDVLFGGPTGEPDASTLSEPQPAPAGSEVSGQVEEPLVAAPKVESEETNDTAEFKPGELSMPDENAEKLPVTEAESTLAAPPPPPMPVVSTSAAEVDEFGLPVALETPPTDLEFAPPPEAAAPPTLGSEQDAFDPSLSPFAAPVAPLTEVAEDDLSGLLAEEELSEPSVQAEAPFLPPIATIPAEEFPAAAPPDLPAWSPEPAPAPLPEFVPPPAQPVPPVTPPAPVAAPPPPPRAPARIESISGMLTQPTVTTEQDLLPSDVQQRLAVSNIIPMGEDQGLVPEDVLKAARVARYVGKERRENLDMQIERLYEDVARDLSVNKEDAEYALRTLSEAQDIILEDTRQYDEALYRVAVVKTMLARKRNLRRWSYTWGMSVFFYAVIWLAAFIAGFLATDILRAAMGDVSEGLMAVRGAWFSALAGGIGGIISILYSLYWHVAMKQDFDRQYVMYYLVQPIMGFILGALIYFIVVAGYLLFNVSDTAVDTVTAIGIVVGFIAGFRQRVVFEMIDRIVKKLLPRSQDEPDAAPVSVVPVEER